uniref:hydroxymethylbilane synthase n=1 Tax=Spongospora subterranea TaxID=70186 RepID=A0A0H5RM98_9EUKA|eukprot:CRZ09844.1 hypothetical protein [Spongospora subterranea]
MAELDPTPIVIGGRASPLAVWQSRLVQTELRHRHAGAAESAFPIVNITSEADVDQTTPLSQFSNKGVFTRHLDRALMSGQIRLAVHSFKDLPTILPEGVMLAAVLDRKHKHDVVVLRDSVSSLNHLPSGTRIGTSSVRRRALLRRHHPHIECVDIRGNIQTRLTLIDQGRVDGVILAAAALHRLNMDAMISIHLTDWPYAVSQGALAVVCRDDDQRAYREAHSLNDAGTALVCVAERALLRTLEGGCKVPIGVNAKLVDGVMTIYGAVIGLDGEQMIEETLSGSCLTQPEADRLGQNLGLALKDKGATSLLRQIRSEIDSQTL